MCFDGESKICMKRAGSVQSASSYYKLTVSKGSQRTQGSKNKTAPSPTLHSCGGGGPEMDKQLTALLMVEI